jgi:hypothetical protein
MRKGWLAVAISLVLMFASLLYVEHVLATSYEAVNYGFPMPWLVYVVSTLLPVNQWVPNVIGLLVDYLFWLGVSFAGVYLLSSQNTRRLFKAGLP